jgi:hypothetical protein
MNFNKAPQLIETGTKYFMKESLKNCRELKQTYYSNIVNILLLISFISIIGLFLYYKKKQKLTPNEKKEINLVKEKFILDKIKTIRENRRKETNDLITNIPKFESHFEILHKKYYKT